MKGYEEKAVKYAERYGIINYKVLHNMMVYREKVKNEGIYKAVVNLDTMEERRKQLYKRS